MGANGSAAALETADVALMDSSLLKLSFARQLGATCTTLIKQNMAFSLLTKLTIMTFAALGRAPLWLAALADVDAMLVVCLNSLRIIGGPLVDPVKNGVVVHHGSDGTPQSLTPQLAP